MKRVVITGIGIISSLGNTLENVLLSLKTLKSGIVFSPSMKNFGMKSQVCGHIECDDHVDRSLLKFMNISSFYSYVAMKDAIQDSDLKKKTYQKNHRVGIIVGVGCNSFYSDINDYYKMKINPNLLIKNMFSNVSSCLSTFYKIFGISYSMSTACATSSSCIHNAVELIQCGKQDIIFAGGSEELNCILSYQFDIMKLLSVKYNHIPQKSSRAYDLYRDGFVISGGSGIIVLEELQHALNRKAKIYAEIVSCGMASDGMNMIKPSGFGLQRAMSIAIKKSRFLCIEYINTHGTSTKIGDVIELESIHNVFKNHIPYISSTKSITGHALGASGVQEVIYTILMLNNNFIAPSINIDTLDPFARNMNIVKNDIKELVFSVAMSNSCGFGGSNVSIIIKKYCNI
ncbi:beta-ketoacyl synthase N-terminal-like domain-containing protein [Buchnera aphidicola]|uniref:beta-ketoacyl synthase N-terminal-like domain-containing protein n=1 Tax=Buchnera aphidicola TaxID=9 RepID=UPI003463D30A